jgi:hypothetical protein
MAEGAGNRRLLADRRPETIHVDNGADFRSKAFIRGCRNEGIDVIWRPPGAPHYGGHIERLIGTMMGEMHLLSGTSFGNPIERGSYDSKQHSAMSLRELERYLGWEIAGGYHGRIHSALMRSPLAIWREHEGRVQLRMPHDRMAFWVSFLPEEHRKLRPDGVWLHGLPYWSNVLSADLGGPKRELLVKYDPREDWDAAREGEDIVNRHLRGDRTPLASARGGRGSQKASGLMATRSCRRYVAQEPVRALEEIVNRFHDVLQIL